MIETPTTFIVGAGGSRPYGFPLAQQLFDDARNLGPESSLYQLIRVAVVPGADAHVLNTIRDEMRNESAQSIDEFLLRRQDRQDVQQVGRGMIAALLAQAEQSSRAQISRAGGGGDWIEKVAREMLAGAATWEAFLSGNRNLKFVTFNFDSIIQHRLQAEAQRAFPRANTAELLEAVSVIHVHGRLPAAPMTNVVVSAVGDLNPEWVEWTRAAAPKVTIVHDGGDDNAWNIARAAIKNAFVICFLGFSYHRDNTKRLSLVDHMRPDAEIFGSAYHEDAGHRPRITRRVGHAIHLGQRDEDALACLRSLPVFRD